MINGIMNIYKEAGYTSHDVVASLLIDIHYPIDHAISLTQSGFFLCVLAVRQSSAT